MQLIPARGRLPLPHRSIPTTPCRIQLSPARGRLHIGTCKISQVHIGCSLAPRGDGYVLAVLVFRDALMQLSPARGRLRFCQSPCVMLCVDAAYPREGTVTSSGKSGRSPVAGYSLAPRGDGYALFLELHSNFKIQLSPARGRLLLGTAAVFHCHRYSLAPRGDGYFTFRESSIWRRDATYPRKGTPRVFSPANFRHFIDNSHILCYTSW